MFFKVPSIDINPLSWLHGFLKPNQIFSLKDTFKIEKDKG